MSNQKVLQESWKGGREGSLPALQQARAWALREAWNDFKDNDYGMLTYICSKVAKVGSGHPSTRRPSPAALSKFFDRVDDDPQWFPGKSYQEKFGPAPLLSGTNRSVVAMSAMAMDSRGQEVSYSSVLAANPAALKNPVTGQPFS